MSSVPMHTVRTNSFTALFLVPCRPVPNQVSLSHDRVLVYHAGMLVLGLGTGSV